MNGGSTQKRNADRHGKAGRLAGRDGIEAMGLRSRTVQQDEKYEKD